MLDSGPRPDWPAYNIEKIGEHNYPIPVMVAGFTEDELKFTQRGPF
ncbi:hypothetical protein [Mesorhizobium sp. B2-4-13]|nr:hypothetical protein [Mesorhizobium sp. B2-4-13]